MKRKIHVFGRPPKNIYLIKQMQANDKAIHDS